MKPTPPNCTTGPGKAVFVTGCSSGIGRAVATRLAQAGYTVFASVRRAAQHEELASLGHPNLVPLSPLDLSTLHHIPPVVDKLHHELASRSINGLFAFVGNAGGGKPAPLEMIDPHMFLTELHTRAVAPVALLQELLPLIRQAKGRILWIVTPALIPTPYVASIHAADFAVNCLARTLEIELKPWNIPNILIRCGGIKTPAGLRTTSDVEELFRLSQSPSSDLYKQRLTRWARDMASFDQKRTEPDKVAEVVLRALTSKSPRRRYSIGHLAWAAALLEALPQPVADTILKWRF